MKFFVWSLGAFLTVFSEDKQNHKPDMSNEDLKNYSYLVSGDTILSIGNGHMQGTDFFYQKRY